MAEEMDYNELREKYYEAQQQIEDFKLKQWADRQKPQLAAMIESAYEWLTENPLRLVTALAIVYMTTATIHAHYNMFMEHRKNMRR